jgi:hypothetical protein
MSRVGTPSDGALEGFRQADGTTPMRRDCMASKALKPLVGQLLLFATCPQCQAQVSSAFDNHRAPG